MPRPLIGISTSNGKRNGHQVVVLMRSYVDAILAADGVPLLVPSGLGAEALKTLHDRLDGYLLSGGGDLAPGRYGEVALADLAKEVDLERDEIEVRLLTAAMKSGKPFLGICRGCQAVNVALGGSLFVDIASQIPEAGEHACSSITEREYLAHTVGLEAGTLLTGILGETEIQVNSLHHQSVKEPAPGLRIVGRAPDGVIEALELTDHPFGIAVQWHPECLPEQAISKRLFSAFVAACREERK